MLLLAVFQVLLYRYSGQDEIIVGGATNTRTRPEFEPLIGYFLNAVVFRSRIGADLTFREFLGPVKGTVLGALAHSEIPFDAIVRELAPKRDSSRHPLFQVLFSMRPPFSDFPDGWDVTDMEVHSGASELRPFRRVFGASGGFGRTVSCTARTFSSAPQSSACWRIFKSLLQELVADPDQAISRVPLLTEPNGRRCWWIGTIPVRAFPSFRLHELFEAQGGGRAPIARRLFFAASS